MRSYWNRLLATPNDGLLTFLRVMAFLVFFPHGAQKALGWFGGGGFGPTLGFFAGMGIPAFFGVLAITAEFLGSLCLLAGFLSRVAAFGLACVMVVAIATVHLPNGFFMNWAGTQPGEGFEYHLLALAALLPVMVRGGGRASVDRRLTERTRYAQRPVIALRRGA